MFEEEGEDHVFPVAAVGDQSKVRQRSLRRTHLEERGWEGGKRGEGGKEEGEGEKGRGREEGREGKGRKERRKVQPYTCLHFTTVL